jgi:hypothetical protein
MHQDSYLMNLMLVIWCVKTIDRPKLPFELTKIVI